MVDVVKRQADQRRVQDKVAVAIVSYQEDARVVFACHRCADPLITDTTDDNHWPSETTTMTLAGRQVRLGRAFDHPVSLDDPFHGNYGPSKSVTAAAGWTDIADRSREDGVSLSLAYLQRLVDARSTRRFQLQESLDRVGLESIDVAFGRLRGGFVAEYDEENGQQKQPR